jgi:ATP-dependent DNA helicase DinG
MKSAPSQWPSMAVGAGGAVRVAADGVVENLDFVAAAKALSKTPHIICNGPLVARRMGLSAILALDVLELFAYVRPAAFCVPTPQGLASQLELGRPADELGDEAVSLQAVVGKLLAELAGEAYRYPKGAKATAEFMGASGWPWAPVVLGTLNGSGAGAGGSNAPVWSQLDEWSEPPPRGAPEDFPVGEVAAIEALKKLLGEGAEQRRAQEDYTRAACFSFTPRAAKDAPNLALLEAGTGIGKTLGYIAPAALWAQQNDGTVWLSTFTKNLQRQLDQELNRLYGSEEKKHQNAVIRKGRENYLCLLNLEETVGKAKLASTPSNTRSLLGLVLRWVLYTRDGDMVGGDFPSWLAAHFGRARMASLSDRRGECVYAACAHYRKCFVERAKRRARDAQLVIANHALVMFEAALRHEEADFSKRLVFDEGHHLFDAADSAFSLHLSGLEAREMRRWLRGREARSRANSRSRARGLRARIEDLVVDDQKAKGLLDEINDAAKCLPDDGWLARITTAASAGPAEAFLVLVRAQVLARTSGTQSFHSIETSTNEPLEGLIEAAEIFAKALAGLARPMGALVARLKRKLDEDADELTSGDRGRLDSAAKSLARRAETILQGWVPMLAAIAMPAEAGFVDWFSLERGEAREYDVGLYRHYLDPTEPFAKLVLEPAHGVLITSATLRDRVLGEIDSDWQSADIRSGAGHLLLPPKRSSYASPFDYGTNTRVFIVGDVDRNDSDQVAGAYRALFRAAGGGGLGLFTAISRLKAVYHQIAGPLEDENIRLYAQHVDPMDAGTLVDMFRDDIDSCLLGTDALRDGVDVPGEALQLIVFDRVPWPRPTILHRARRAAFGGSAYDDMVTRLRLKQAFGRLIRRKSDRGIFIMLDQRTPSRLLDAFPGGVEVARISLLEAIGKTRDFLTL